MRNIVILNSLHFSYPLPILMRVSYNTLIVKQNTSDYYKYRQTLRTPEADEFKKEGASDLIPALLLSFQYLFSLIYLA